MERNLGRPCLHVSAAWLLVLSTVLTGMSYADPARADDDDFVQTNLVSDLSGVAAIADPALKNPWGLSHSPTSPFWSSNQGTSTATLYAVTDKTTVTKVNINPPAGDVLIPTTATGPQGPTGQVNNSNTSSFPVNHGGDGGPAHFIFANLNGTITAWDKGPAAFVQVTTPGAVYTGLAINGAQTRLYAAGAGGIDVFDSSFNPVDLGPGAFVNPQLSRGLAPFNIRNISGDILVTYAPLGRMSQINAQRGAGAIAIFTEDGTFIKQLVAGSHLAAPWGMALAPPSFGRFSNHLLVGNFSFIASEINSFDLTKGEFHGRIPVVSPGRPGGLWSLDFGIGGNNGDPDTLYFTDGINGEADGLFGAISLRQEPDRKLGDAD
jgi:uncharacterized protein (TIGR03118 family)